MTARTNICATGVEWRRLGLSNEARYLGRGLYYGAGMSEAPLCRNEQVFIDIANGRPLTIDGETLTPVRVKGWYHALFRNEEGEDKLLSIDQLLAANSAR